MGQVSSSFSQQAHLVEFGRYEGVRPVEPPAHEVLIGREAQRARLLNLLLTVGRKGAYLVTGHRGSGKTTFVRFCLDEYTENVFRRYLASNVGRSIVWDRLGHLGFGVLVILAALLFTEMFQEIANRDELSLLDWLLLLPLLLVCCYPLLLAKELIDFVLNLGRASRSASRRWVSPLGIMLALGAFLVGVWPFGSPALATSQLAFLAAWLYVVTNVLAVSARPNEDDPGAEDPSFDLAPMKSRAWQLVRASALLAGIALPIWHTVEPANGLVLQNWFSGLLLLGCGAGFRFHDQRQLARELHGTHRKAGDERSPCHLATCNALSEAARWHLRGAICVVIVGLVGTAFNWYLLVQEPAKKSMGALAISLMLATVGGIGPTHQ